METRYNNDTYDSIQQPEFFNEKEMNWVKDIYWNMFDDFCKTYMPQHISEKKNTLGLKKQTLLKALGLLVFMALILLMF